jgi:hypothetical protein
LRVPQLGDSLRIDAAGPVADIPGNKANPLNRTVVITQKGIPASIVQAWYLDKNADGVVDAVDIKFNKAVLLSDAVVSLDWGNQNKADSISASLLSSIGTDNLGIEISVRGVFKGISTDSIKTSGSMHATVGYISNPDAPAGSDVADSAAPVIVSANFLPTSSLTGKDTLLVVFSEPVPPISYATPFKLFSNNSGVSYYFTLSDTTKVPSLFHGFIISQMQGVNFPNTGDSIWIDIASGIGDTTAAVQLNVANRRALLNVKSIPYTPHVVIVKNPFSIGAPVSDAGISGTGTIIEVPPPLRMADANHLPKSGTITIYDVVGNTVLKDDPFTLSNSWLYYNWNGRNFNNRYVGAGMYVAVITVTLNSGTVTSSRITIGVKR